MNPQEIDQTSKTQIIHALSEKLAANYVFPDIAERLCSELKDSLDGGDFDGIKDGEEFALTLTLMVQETSKDEHLWVRWHEKPLPEHEGSLLQNEEKILEFKQRSKLDNFGFHKAERLPGNVGYIDIRYFTRPSWGSGDTAVAAMNFVANANALIIDLRKCGGGNPGMVTLISSYLFGGEPIHLNSLYWRDEDFTQQYWTLPFIPGKQFLDRPVYVLTSSYTFSAGEEFAYNLQALKRATLVGETTSGGAHPGSPIRLHPHCEAFIPLGKAINPITKDNWEGRGVIPDIQVDAENAFNTAYKLALEAILQDMAEPVSVPHGKYLAEVQTALKKLGN